MKKLLLPLLLPGLLMLTACNSKTTDSTNTPNADSAAKALAEPQTAAADVKLACREIASMDEMVPLSEIQLVVGSKVIPVDSSNTCNVIEPSEYAGYKIPSTAKMAVGGWFAGGGDYFYLAIEGGEAVVYAGWADEGADEKDLYQYQVIHREKL